MHVFLITLEASPLLSLLSLTLARHVQFRNAGRPLSSLSNDGDNDVSDLVQIWQTNKTIPISQWKSPAVIAFLHVHLQMPMYTNHCMENVKSGKVLADMSDVELSKSIGIISYMHRRKIRLAIEDFRHPASV